MIKLFASDIDGTILPSDESIGQPIYDALTALSENGVTFMLISGRDKYALQTIQDRLHISCPCVGLNGAVTYAADGTLACPEVLTIPDDAADIINDLAVKYHCYYVAHCKTGNYANMPDDKTLATLSHIFVTDRGYDTEKAIAYAQEYIDFAKAIIMPEYDFEYVKKQGIVKIEFYYLNDENFPVLEETLAKLPGTMTCPTPYNSAEMTHHLATKGNALDAYRTSLGLEQSEIAVIGDAENDFSMFLPEATKFAMGNAHPFLKERATHVVADVNHFGFAEAVQIVLEKNRSEK